jgi:3D (Asp-Asp-Asp) domain-containing protein
MEAQQKPKMDYRQKGKILSIIKTWIIVVLLIVLASGGTFTVMNYQMAADYKANLGRALGVIEGTIENFTTSYNTVSSTLQDITQEVTDLEVEVKQVNNIGVWDVFTVTAYTSLDDGVNETSAIGMNIAKWSKYFGVCAINPDGPIDYGDTVIVRMPDGTMKSYIAVDTGGALTEDQIDLYFGYNLEEAFDFGRQRLEVWVLK